MENQAIDTVFGQTRAFALNDEAVNPEVVEYLKSVRQEALRTHVAKTPQITKYKASLYDDDETYEPKFKRSKYQQSQDDVFKGFRNKTDIWLNWYNTAKHDINEKSDLPISYDERTLDLLLHYLKQYLSALPEKGGASKHLLDILQDHRDVEEDSELQIDENWAVSIIKTLNHKNIRNLNDIKGFLRSSSEESPTGFKQWYYYMQKNEPTHSAFVSTINNRNLWVLVQYMNHEWLKDIAKCKKQDQAVRLSNWLLYILFHLPKNITAGSVSNLRELGKKCHKLIKDNETRNENEEPKIKIPQIRDNLPSEIISLKIPSPPENLNIIELSLALVAIVYRQGDLITEN